MLSHSNVLLKKKKKIFNKDKNNYNYKTNQHTNQKRQLDKDNDMVIVKCKKVKRFSKHILHKPILSYTLTRAITKFQEYCLDAIIRRRIELSESGFAFTFPLFPLKVSGVMFMVVREIPGPCSHRCPLMEYCSNLEHYKKTVRNK